MKRFLGSALWLITALAAIFIGLAAVDYDVATSPVVINNFAGLVRPAKILIGVAGLLSLLMYVSSMFSKGCMCGCHEKVSM